MGSTDPGSDCSALVSPRRVICVNTVAEVFSVQRGLPGAHPYAVHRQEEEHERKREEKKSSLGR